jgi:hypothetical protein
MKTLAEFRSRAGNTVFTVTLTDKGTMRCNCLAFRFSKVASCRHIKLIRESDNQVSKSIQGDPEKS